MKIICVTGSVGTGKTTISKRLSKAINFKYIDVNLLIKKNKIKTVIINQNLANLKKTLNGRKFVGTTIY